MDDAERAALAKEFAACMDLILEATRHITPECVEARLREVLRRAETGGDGDDVAHRLGQSERG